MRRARNDESLAAREPLTKRDLRLRGFLPMEFRSMARGGWIFSLLAFLTSAGMVGGQIPSPPAKSPDQPVDWRQSWDKPYGEKQEPKEQDRQEPKEQDKNYKNAGNPISVN